MSHENKMHVKKVLLRWSNKRNTAKILCLESLTVTLEKGQKNTLEQRH